MSNELIISANPDQVSIALMSEGKLMELHQEDTKSNFSVGDLYLGTVKKLVPGLNSAFVNVGYEKDAFLHYHDLGPQFKSLLSFIKRTQNGKQTESTLNNFPAEVDIDKNGKINEALKSGQEILVQIAKEPISTKGPRISSELSIAGRYLVLVPFSNRVSISQKIRDRDEKDHLRKIITGIKPKGFGVIVRTVAKNRELEDLQQDLNALLKKWDNVYKKLKSGKAPAKILSELDRASSVMRDVFNDSFTNIVVDDEALYLEICDYLSHIAPEKENIVKLHSSNIPVFEKYGVERQVKTSFGRSVSMSKGAYLIIEHTEALHVIDVNSGNRANSKESQETNALEVNLIAAKEISRQLQLRDMGGIIVVDFIDLHKAENRKILFDKMKEYMREDRAKHKILPPSKFGLIQITRQRVRPEMEIKTMEPDPSGKGKEVEAPIHIIDELDDVLETICTKQDFKGITLNVHPFVSAYLKEGFISRQMKWFFKYKKWIKVLPRDAYQYLQYRFYDQDGKLIKVK